MKQAKHGKRRKAANKMRKTASRDQLSRLRHHLGWCYWCGWAIVRMKTMQRLNRQGKIRLIKVRRRGEPAEFVYHVPLANNGGAFLARIATVDHVTPISEGGGNKANVVDACKECNCRRGVENSRNRPAPYGCVALSIS